MLAAAWRGGDGTSARPASDLGKPDPRTSAVVFGIRLPRALTAGFIDQALKASEGVAGLSAATRGLIAARTAVMAAVAAIDADMRRRQGPRLPAAG